MSECSACHGDTEGFTYWVKSRRFCCSCYDRLFRKAEPSTDGARRLAVAALVALALLALALVALPVAFGLINPHAPVRWGHLLAMLLVWALDRLGRSLVDLYSDAKAEKRAQPAQTPPTP